MSLHMVLVIIHMSIAGLEHTHAYTSLYFPQPVVTMLPHVCVIVFGISVMATMLCQRSIESSQWYAI
jgi:hypothetical protein